MLNRLTLLPMAHTSMKLGYFLHFSEKGFKGYRSPWVPVTRENLPQVKKHLDRTGSGLFINDFGTEIPYPEGRDIQLGRTGEIRETRKIWFDGDGPRTLRFIWVDARKEDTAALAGSKGSDYEQYNKFLGEFLAFLSRNQRCLGRVRFPLFYGTTLDLAYETQKLGFDYNETQESVNEHYGFSLQAVPERESSGKLWRYPPSPGEPGGLVALKPFDENIPPVWLNINEEPIAKSDPVSALNHFLKHYIRIPLEDDVLPPYTWEIVCKELFHAGLPVTALFHGGIVHIYEPDPYNYYTPGGIIED